MAFFSDYNPNYEERRGRYAPGAAPNRRQDANPAEGGRQDAAMPAKETEQPEQETNEQELNDES